MHKKVTMSIFNLRNLFRNSKKYILIMNSNLKNCYAIKNSKKINNIGYILNHGIL